MDLTKKDMGKDYFRDFRDSFALDAAQQDRNCETLTYSSDLTSEGACQCGIPGIHARVCAQNFALDPSFSGLLTASLRPHRSMS